MGITLLFGSHTKQRHVQDIGFVGIDQRNLPRRQLRRNQIFLDGIGMNLLRSYCTLISVLRTTSLSIFVEPPRS